MRCWWYLTPEISCTISNSSISYSMIKYQYCMCVIACHNILSKNITSLSETVVGVVGSRLVIKCTNYEVAMHSFMSSFMEECVFPLVYLCVSWIRARFVGTSLFKKKNGMWRWVTFVTIRLFSNTFLKGKTSMFSKNVTI